MHFNNRAHRSNSEYSRQQSNTGDNCMNHPDRRQVSLLAALMLFALTASYSSAHAASGGSYGSSAVPRTIYAKNFNYDTYFKFVGGVPPTSAQIINVVYRWSYIRRPSSVQLCQVGGACTNITNAGAGTIRAPFAGASATGQFFLRAAITGSGTMSPDAGTSGQVIVNYKL